MLPFFSARIVPLHRRFAVLSNSISNLRLFNLVESVNDNDELVTRAKTLLVRMCGVTPPRSLIGPILKAIFDAIKNSPVCTQLHCLHPSFAELRSLVLESSAASASLDPRFVYTFLV